MYAYNSTPHETTKFSPFELMFGRKAKLPVDSMFQETTNDILTEKQPYSDYIKDLKERIERTRTIVKEHTYKARSKQNHYFDKKS